MNLLHKISQNSLRVLGFLFVIFVASSASAADRPSSKDLTKYFEDVVFGAEFGELTEDQKFVHKRTRPMRISISAMDGKLITGPDGKRELKMANRRPSQKAVASIQKHLNTLVKLTGVKTEDSKKVGKPANVFIKLVPPLAMHAPFLDNTISPKTLKHLAQVGSCYLIFSGPNGEIERATIVVNNQLPDDLMDGCILEELTQAFGLKNDSDIVQPSIFNQLSTGRRLTRTDIILLVALYDEKIKPGMHLNEAMPIASGIIEHLNRVMAP